MKIPGIKLHNAADLANACSLLEKYGESAKALAGGTDLVVDLKQKRAVFEHIVVLGGIAGLDEIKLRKGILQIGALTSLASLAESRIIKKHLPALSDAASTMATPQVRNMGTIGGNVAMAVPSADLPPTLIAANARIITDSPTGSRIIPIREFFTGPRKTVLGAAELIREIEIDVPPANSGLSYKKFQLRNSAALAVVGVAASLVVEDGKISDACIVLGAVAPTPLIAVKASRSLIGAKPDFEAFANAGKIACEEGKPISDIRGSKEFRCRLIGVLTRRALEEANGRIRTAPKRRKN
ncbi:MAG: xanthine dehydrogenase family protein subunit M [bacterium]|nr:xanthine dehydrogenase family protein subunit M [bacterium]